MNSPFSDEPSHLILHISLYFCKCDERICLTCFILSGQIDLSFKILFKQSDLTLWLLLAVDVVLLL